VGTEQGHSWLTSLGPENSTAHCHLHAQAIEKNRKINQNTNKPKELKQAARYCNNKMITTEASP